MGKREAYKLALKNAAGLIACMDLQQMFGDTDEDADYSILEGAQEKVVALLEKAASELK